MERLKPSAGQRAVLDLEQGVRIRLTDLDAESVMWIACAVSEWGGDNQKAIEVVLTATPEENKHLAELIGRLLSPSTAKSAIFELTAHPGIGLVMASKIYRFCCSEGGQQSIGTRRVSSTRYTYIERQWIRLRAPPSKESGRTESTQQADSLSIRFPAVREALGSTGIRICQRYTKSPIV